MPTFDGGHYFLTALVPIRTDDVDDGLAVTSPVHALRKRLDMLPTAAATPAHRGGRCPFTHNKRNHFARLVIIDDVAYNGREPGNKFSALFANLTVAQPQDHLSCPFLLFAVDFDAKSGADAERDGYLAELWNTMGGEVRDIFRFCQGFHGRVTDAASFAKYIADCQLETTMSFNDYYIGSVKDLLIKPAQKYLGVAGVIAAVVVLGLIGILYLLGSAFLGQPGVSPFWHAVILTLLCAVAIGIVLVTVYMTILVAGSRPFAAAPDSNLPTVLKALHLQRAFTRFAIDNQMDAASNSAASAQKLYDDFAKFIAVNDPNNLDHPTQDPGVIGI
jgi:hypothetical protein